MILQDDQTVDYREEVSTKLMFTIQNKFHIDINELRPIIDSTLLNYSIDKECTSLVVTDLPEKLRMYLKTKTLEEVSKGTLENYYREISNFGRHVVKPVNTVTIMDLRRYLALHHGKIKNSTMNSKISKLKTFFTWLHTEGYISNNPSLRLKHIKTEKRVRKPLTEEELELLVNSCKTLREKAIINMLYTTGCRVSELVDMNKSDIDWHERSLLVIGKGNKQREVLFSTRAKISLLDYLESRGDDNDALFVSSRKPHGRLCRNTILREVKKVGKRTGDGIHVFPHLLRATMATHSINSDMPLNVVQELLGHSKTDTTLIYAHTSRGTVKREYAKL